VLPFWQGQSRFPAADVRFGAPRFVQIELHFGEMLSRVDGIRMFQLDGIDHVALAVRDVARTTDWYLSVLGFERQHQGMWNGIPVFIGRGNTAIALFPIGTAEAPARSAGSKSGGMLHLAFRASRQDFRSAQEDLTARGIPFHFEDHEISHSIYFQDPDGHQLEITTYEVE
jgi:catechol 2,3-dioxygenase-like lactoylglutathione lyase family enzyme